MEALIHTLFCSVVALINSSVIFLVPLADRIFLQATLPKSLWYAVISSIFGSILIALSHVSYLGEEDDVVSRTNTLQSLVVNPNELYGCFLQMISCLFIVAMRLLIRMTEGIIQPTELVQSANIGSVHHCFVFVFYTLYFSSIVYNNIFLDTFFFLGPFYSLQFMLHALTHLLGIIYPL